MKAIRYKGSAMKRYLPKLLVFVLVLSVQAGMARADRWSDLVAKGRAEGTVVISTNFGLPSFREGLTNEFQKEYGIKVDFRTLGSSEMASTMLRECSVHRATLDVTISGNDGQIYDAGCFAPLKPVLVLPTVVEGKYWKGGRLKFNDPKHEYMLETITSLYGWVIINSDQIKDNELVHAKDLLKPQYAGKIAAFDPRIGGAGLNMASYLYQVLGEGFVKNFYVGQKVVFTRNYSQLGEWIARGSYAIGIGAAARGVEPYRKQGLPIKAIQLKDVAYTAGSVGVLRLSAGAPHPNAAAVFINWFASQEGQKLFSKAIAEPSRRVDVPPDDVAPYIVPKPGVKYFDTYSWDFSVKHHADLQKKVAALVGQ
jgi:iron(III) transport system substrate-binding protein